MEIKAYYEEPGITIYYGDCLEIMKEIPDKSVDLVLTDPPYGVKRDKGFSGYGFFKGKGKPIMRRRYDDDWDSQRPKKEYFDEIIRVGRLCLIFGGNYYADILPQSRHWIVWDKLNTMPSYGDCELIWTNHPSRKSVKKITYKYNGLFGREKWRAHPTQKPVAFIGQLINKYSEPSQVILDPFLGSGTTLIACKELKRKGIGIEINKKYCDMAIQRLKNITPNLF
jgi:DNA modification methylase